MTDSLADDRIRADARETTTPRKRKENAMEATITKIEGNRIEAIVRRNHRAEGVQGIRDEAIRIGQRIEVKRQTNNPYLVFVGMVR